MMTMEPDRPTIDQDDPTPTRARPAARPPRTAPHPSDPGIAPAPARPGPPPAVPFSKFEKAVIDRLDLLVLVAGRIAGSLSWILFVLVVTFILGLMFARR
jgi:hypothetical protein